MPEEPTFSQIARGTLQSNSTAMTTMKAVYVIGSWRAEDDDEARGVFRREGMTARSIRHIAPVGGTR